ncbi:MAG: transcription termination/antitermination protein NusA [Candidatus Berkelbacteria bacterium]|nr:MAG: transcription termination/antitermination protein NusA [Candidatus Berkelbacteria bacterium]QQG51390.1 MAG: transcription termination/antitermination protein NusA [Candidatus Berkelbacteria bacterium]
MAISPFAAAINQLADERGLPRETVVDSIQAAVAAAYRKEYGHQEQEVRAELNEESGKFHVFQQFEVVEPGEEGIENIHAQLTEEDAQKIKKGAKVGEIVEIELEPHEEFGRIAAMTAKQVISQRLREAEKEILFAEYKDKEGQLINGYVQQVEGPNVILNIGKLNGLMIASDQIPNQNYFPGQRLKVLVYTVEETARGPRVLVTRSSADFIKKLFELEVPEIAAGSVEIKTIAREAGTRTKMAVISTQPGLDPVGSCVGQRGTRVQAVLSELGDEKIDIIPFIDSDEEMIINALSPAKVEKIILKKKAKIAAVVVPEDQLSLAIGKNGQNVRLASKLTGWEIDIVKTDGTKASAKKPVEDAAELIEKSEEHTEEEAKQLADAAVDMPQAETAEVVSEPETTIAPTDAPAETPSETTEEQSETSASDTEEK